MSIRSGLEQGTDDGLSTCLKAPEGGPEPLLEDRQVLHQELLEFAVTAYSWALKNVIYGCAIICFYIYFGQTNRHF